MRNRRKGIPRVKDPRERQQKDPLLSKPGIGPRFSPESIECEKISVDELLRTSAFHERLKALVALDGDTTHSLIVALAKNVSTKENGLFLNACYAIFQNCHGPYSRTVYETESGTYRYGFSGADDVHRMINAVLRAYQKLKEK